MGVYDIGVKFCELLHQHKVEMFECWLKGRTIEVLTDGEWHVTPHPRWNLQSCYRVQRTEEELQEHWREETLLRRDEQDLTHYEEHDSGGYHGRPDNNIIYVSFGDGGGNPD